MCDIWYYYHFLLVHVSLIIIIINLCIFRNESGWNEVSRLAYLPSVVVLCKINISSGSLILPKQGVMEEACHKVNLFLKRRMLQNNSWVILPHR